MFKRMLLITAAVALVASSAGAHVVPTSKFIETANPYGPYEFLIGDWYTKLPQENAIVHQQFGWGPGKASMTYATFVAVPGKPEHLHFGGTMIWNPTAKALDYLFAVEPGSGVEERGTITVQPDGGLVREVEAIYPDGKVLRSRQTFHRGDDGTVATDVQSETPKGWVSSLRGGAMVMSRTAPE
jgi:hypothetical protein